MLTRSLKKRGLRQAPGYTGAEGYDCHDWMLVDTNNMIIQIMDTETRDVSCGGVLMFISIDMSLIYYPKSFPVA